MRATILLCSICLTLRLPAAAQQQRWHIKDTAGNRGLTDVLLVNTASGSRWLSDSLGYVAFAAAIGDVVEIKSPGYKRRLIVVREGLTHLDVSLEKAATVLSEVRVLSPMALYMRDYIFNRQVFRKEIAYAGFKPSQKFYGNKGGPMGIDVGVEYSGLLSNIALKASGRKRAARRFSRELAYLEGGQLSAIRYTPALVSVLTGMDDAESLRFIVRNPLTHVYLETASELELKMRIRELFASEQQVSVNRR